MRTLEWLMAVLSVPAAVWTIFVRRPWPVWILLATAAVGLLLPFHAAFEGVHWQMAPIYIAVLLLLYLLIRQFGSPKPQPVTIPQLILGWAATLLLVGGLALCYTIPMFRLGKITGSYPIATRTLYFVDPSRKETHPRTPRLNREVVVQLWYPSATSSGPHAMYRELKETDLRSSYQAVLKIESLRDAPIAPGRFPVILFNHAWRGFGQRSTYITQELASHGFVVVGISHPYNAAKVMLHDGTVADGRSQTDLGDFYSTPTLSLEQRMAMADNEMRIQTDDDKFVLDQLAAINQSATNPLAGHMDLTHVGAFGHSFGGSVSAELASEDSRVLSAIVLDGVLMGPVADTGLNKPLFRIKAETPEMPPGSENSPIQSTRVHAQMYKLGEGALAASFKRWGGYNVELRGIDHENFSDKGFFSPFHSLSGIGDLPMSRAATLIDAYILAFFEQTLRDQPQPLLSDAKPPFPEVVHFQIFPRPPSVAAGRSSAAR
jgi:dienelactone hydrolase